MKAFLSPVLAPNLGYGAMAAYRVAALSVSSSDVLGPQLAAVRSSAGDSSLPIGCGSQYGGRSLRVLNNRFI